MSLINPKCAVLSALAVVMYYRYPTRDSSMHLLYATALASGTYITLSWYDAVYDCKDKNIASEWFSLYRPFKPPVNDLGEYAFEASAVDRDKEKCNG